MRGPRVYRQPIGRPVTGSRTQCTPGDMETQSRLCMNLVRLPMVSQRGGRRGRLLAVKISLPDWFFVQYIKHKVTVTVADQTPILGWWVGALIEASCRLWISWWKCPKIRMGIPLPVGNFAQSGPLLTLFFSSCPFGANLP